MKGYLSGPMTGIPNFNFPAFEAAAMDLRTDGIDIVSPHERDKDAGVATEAQASPDGDMPSLVATTGVTLGDLLGGDVKAIADEDFDAIFVLPGWETSKGARLEVFLAVLLDIPIYSYETRRCIFKHQVMKIINASLGLLVINNSIRQDH